MEKMFGEWLRAWLHGLVVGLCLGLVLGGLAAGFGGLVMMAVFAAVGLAGLGIALWAG